MNKTQQGYFESIPQADELYFTKDELCFRTKQQAEKHHTTIGEPLEEVEGFTRQQYLDSEKTAEGTGAENTEVSTLGAVKPYSRMNKTELTEEAAKRNLDISQAPNNKAIVELLQADDTAQGGA